MRTRPYMALMLLGFFLLTACDGGDSGIGSIEKTAATNCTLGISTLDSCTLN